MGYISRTACDTPVDYCARLCFPLAADEPPRLFRFSPLVFLLPSNQLLEGTKQMKPTFTITKKTNH